MPDPFRFSALRASLLALLAMLALPAAAQVSPAKQAEIAALRERVTELRVEEMLIRSDIREVGGAATIAQGMTNARVSKDYAEEQIRRLDSVIDAYVKSTEEMEQLQRQAASDIDRRIEEANQGIGNKAKDKVLDYAGTQGLSYLLATETGPLLSIGIKIVDRSGRAVVAEINERRLGEQILAERRNLIKALEVKLSLTNQAAAEIVRIRELQALQQRFRANNDALATANARLEELLNPRRDTVAAPVAPTAAPPKPRASIRLCDPNQRHRPTGVRAAEPSSKGASAAGKPKPAPAKPADQPVADGDACRDITGLWTVQQSIEVHGRSAPMGAPLRGEIVRAADAPGTDALPRYELYGPDKATARNGPLMRCTRDGYRLSCQRRVQQQACPAAKYVWAPLELTVAADLSAIGGELRQAWLMDARSDPSGCTVVAGGQGSIAFRLLPQGN